MASSTAATPDAPSVQLNDATLRQLGYIPDDEVRTDATETVRLALECIAALGRLHLPQDNFETTEAGRDANDKHLELAPYVLGALALINRLLQQITDQFPAPAEPAEEEADDDFDFEFDLVGDEAGGNGADDGLDKSQLPPRERLGEAAHAYGGMLRSRVLQFAARLRNCVRQTDNWPLLAELDDTHHRLTKSVQGLLFGVLNEYGVGLRREEVLPEYRSVLSESIALRAAVAELSYHIGKFNAALAQSDSDTAVPLLVGVSDRLARFAAKPEYRTMRAEDKKAIIDFRQELFKLRSMKSSLSMQRLRLVVEGFSKFLESMQAINHREVLVLHDRQRLEAAIAQIEQIQASLGDDAQGAAVAFTALVQGLGLVQGRSPDLDEARRTALRDGVHATNIATLVMHWRMLLESTLGSVG